jgi:isoquinoline 1-oxidoreductase alpha subunit
MSTFTVNGKPHNFDGDPEMPLLWYLRDLAGMTGTKFGCGLGLCGACTVHIDSTATRSCVTPMGNIDGRTITTIEGLSRDGTHPVQVAWRELNVAQCGYCQSGQIMQAASLLKATPKPTNKEIDAAMSGNICRCGTYPRIRAAIKRAAEGV